MGNKTNIVNNDKGLPETIVNNVGTNNELNTTIIWHTQYALPVEINTRGVKIRYDYDSSGRLLSKSIFDENQNKKSTTSYKYNNLGILDSIDGPRTDISDITQFAYDNNGFLNKITNALSQVATFADYDAGGRPQRLVDFSGNETLISYDKKGKVLSLTEGTNKTSFAYDSRGLLDKTTLPSGIVVDHEYDNAHRLVKTIDSLGNITDYTYDNMSNLTGKKTKDSSANVKYQLSMIYNKKGWLEKLAKGNATSTWDYSYNALGALMDSKNPKSYVTTNIYNGLDQLQTVKDALNGEIVYNYTPKGFIESVKTPNGALTSYHYNNFNELAEVNSPDSGVMKYTYDEADNVKSTTDARGKVSTYTYDALNRVKTISNNDNQSFSYFYDETPDSVGQLSRIVDSESEVKFEYFTNGTLKSATKVQKGITTKVSYIYNNDDNIKTIIYPSGAVVAYDYDQVGNIAAIKVTQGNQTRTILSNALYEPFGPLKSFVWGNGQLYSASFDLAYKLTEQKTSALASRNYLYDENDNVKQVKIGDSIRDYTYDELDRLFTEKNLFSSILKYQYDLNGNRLNISNNEVLEDSLTYKPLSNVLKNISGKTNATLIYDASGNLIQDDRFNYSYDGFGRLVHVSGANLTIDYAYNAKHQRIRKTVNGVNTYYQYDTNGSLLAEVDSSGKTVKEYIYLGSLPVAQLGGVAKTNAQTISFKGNSSDVAGETGTLVVDLGNPNKVSFTSSRGVSKEFTAQQLTVSDVNGAKRFTADLQDNGSTWQLVANAKSTDPTSSVAWLSYNQKIQFNGYYDQIVFKDSTTLVGKASSGKEIMAKFNTSTNQITLSYENRSVTISPNLRYTFQPSSQFVVFMHDADGLKVQGYAASGYGYIQIDEQRTLSSNLYMYGQAPLVSATTQSPLYFLHTDHLATVHTITDEQKAVVWQGEHNAFGETQITTNLLESNLRFPGQYYDAETGLYYNWHRYYNPKTGRYISSDPIGLAGGINTYGYAVQNPVNNIDPSGLFITSVDAACATNPQLCAEIVGDYVESAARIIGGDCSSDAVDIVKKGIAGAAALAIVYQFILKPHLDNLSNLPKGTLYSGIPINPNVKQVIISRSKYPETAKHIEEAIANGKSDILTIQRGGARQNRKDSLEGIATQPKKDRDEYPPAMFEEGGKGASVKHIGSSDNRGAGSCMGKQCTGLPDGTKIQIIIGD